MWRLRRVGGLVPMWARYDEFERNWSWTEDEVQAFSAHNRYITEALQRRAPDWLRYFTEVERADDGLEPRKRPTKRGEAGC